MMEYPPVQQDAKFENGDANDLSKRRVGHIILDQVHIRVRAVVLQVTLLLLNVWFGSIPGIRFGPVRGVPAYAMPVRVCNARIIQCLD
jgi:hypothetical protein